MKKVNIFLIILILVFGGYLLYYQISSRNNTEKDTQISQEQEGNDTVITDIIENRKAPEPKNPLVIPEEELIKQIKNKEYLESTYMSLEYSKINNTQLVNTLTDYVSDGTNMKPEDISSLIDIHEKTFLNRYLKVFVMAPDSELYSMNSQMRRILYQMKSAYDTLSSYGGKKNTAILTEGTEGAPQEPAEPTPSSEEEIEYNIEDIRTGIQQLEQVNLLVDEALETLGKEDIEIEQKWLETNVTESDIVEVIDKSNSMSIEDSEPYYEMDEEVEEEITETEED